jgi:hypothetical protein
MVSTVQKYIELSYNPNFRDILHINVTNVTVYHASHSSLICTEYPKCLAEQIFFHIFAVENLINNR